jgi:transcriptional regulator with GAF, ATPase, and Fis domain
MIMSNGEPLRIDIPRNEHAGAGSATDLTAVERSHIFQVLSETGWRIRGEHGAAARLSMKPTTLESRMKKLGVVRPGAEPAVDKSNDWESQ